MTGDMMGMKATGKPVGQMRLHVYWFNDDGLVERRCTSTPTAPG